MVGKNRLHELFGRLTEGQLNAGYLRLGALDFRLRRLDIALVAIENRERNSDRGETLHPTALPPGWPDEKALAVLLKVIPANTTQCTNFDCIKLGFGRAALAWFDDALLRTQVSPERLLHLCPPEGKCK